MWLKLLKIDHRIVHSEYNKYRQQSRLVLSKHVADTIDVDVRRSFTQTEGVEPQNLANILNTYAVVDPALDYCQGMNFIAGFLFLMFQDEATVFAVMRQIIKKYEFSKLFNTETTKLKLMFYQLDRLISILVPDVHAHFKVRHHSSELTFCVGRKCQQQFFLQYLLHHNFHLSNAESDLWRTHVEVVASLGLLHNRKCIYCLNFCSMAGRRCSK